MQYFIYLRQHVVDSKRVLKTVSCNNEMSVGWKHSKQNSLTLALLFAYHTVTRSFRAVRTAFPSDVPQITTLSIHLWKWLVSHRQNVLHSPERFSVILLLMTIVTHFENRSSYFSPKIVFRFYVCKGIWNFQEINHIWRVQEFSRCEKKQN